MIGQISDTFMDCNLIGIRLVNKRLFFILIGVLASSFNLFGQQNFENLIKKLDVAISKKNEFSIQKENRLDSLKLALASESLPEKKIKILDKLFKEYEHYNLDGALRVAKEKRITAQQLNAPELLYEANMNTAHVMGKMGMYKETFEILSEIKKDKLAREALPYYYHVYHSTYLLLYNSAFSEEERFKYKQYINSLKDTLLGIIDSSSTSYKLILAGKYLEDGNPQMALSSTLSAYKKVDRHNDSAALYYPTALAYEAVGDLDKQTTFLAMAAIQDIENSVKSYIALRKLALILYQKGDFKRAFNYMKCGMEDALFAKARFRLVEISKDLPVIAASYDREMLEKQKMLTRYLWIISLLVIILLISIYLIYVQLKKVSTAENFLKSKNSELNSLNNQLLILNNKISESEHVKEAYIAYVFRLYSLYIRKFDDYRLGLQRMLKTQRTDEAIRILSLENSLNNELKEFFQNFDAIFLSIFPTFIEEFNEMLIENERIYPKEKDILTPELRIYALIRLGINDSARIAELLHYSPQTVYNYKIKIKNKLAISKEEFIEKILVIGR